MESVDFDKKVIVVTDDAATAVVKKRKRVEEDLIKDGNRQKRIKRLDDNPHNDSSMSLLIDIDDVEPSTSKGIKRKQVDCYETDVVDQHQSMEEPYLSNISVKRQKMEPEVLSISHITTQYSAFNPFKKLTKKEKRFQQYQEAVREIHRLIFTSTNADDLSKQLNKISENKTNAQVSHSSKLSQKSSSSRKNAIKPPPQPTFLKLAASHCMDWTTKSVVDGITFDQSFKLLIQVAQQFYALEMPEIASDLIECLQSTLKNLRKCNPVAFLEQFPAEKLIRYRMDIIRIEDRFCHSNRETERKAERDANICKLIKKYFKYKNCISPEIESEMISFLKEEALHDSDNQLIHRIFKYWLVKSKDEKTNNRLPTSFLIDAIRFVLEITKPVTGRNGQTLNQKNVFHLDGQLNTLIHAIARRQSGFIINHPETAIEIVQLLIQFKIFDWDFTNTENKTVICIVEEYKQSDCDEMRRNRNPFYEMVLKEKKRLTHSVQPLACLAARQVSLKSGLKCRLRSIEAVANRVWRKSMSDFDVIKGLTLKPMSMDLFIECHRKPAVCCTTLQMVKTAKKGKKIKKINRR